MFRVNLGGLGCINFKPRKQNRLYDSNAIPLMTRCYHKEQGVTADERCCNGL